MGKTTKNKEVKSLKKRIRKQFEFYFSDSNIHFDKFIQQLLEKYEDYIPLQIIADFPRVKAMTEDLQTIQSALGGSKLLELSSDCKGIKRTKPPEPIDEDELMERTIFVENIPLTTTHDKLTEYFSNYGKVNLVSLPRNKKKAFKGFGFVEFAKASEAKEACTKESALRVCPKALWLAGQQRPAGPRPGGEWGDGTAHEGARATAAVRGARVAGSDGPWAPGTLLRVGGLPLPSPSSGEEEGGGGGGGPPADGVTRGFLMHLFSKWGEVLSVDWPAPVPPSRRAEPVGAAAGEGEERSEGGAEEGAGGGGGGGRRRGWALVRYRARWQRDAVLNATTPPLLAEGLPLSLEAVDEDSKHIVDSEKCSANIQKNTELQGNYADHSCNTATLVVAENQQNLPEKKKQPDSALATLCRKHVRWCDSSDDEDDTTELTGKGSGTSDAEAHRQSQSVKQMGLSPPLQTLASKTAAVIQAADVLQLRKEDKGDANTSTELRSLDVAAKGKRNRMKSDDPSPSSGTIKKAKSNRRNVIPEMPSN